MAVGVLWALVNKHGTAVPFGSKAYAEDALAGLPVSEGWELRQVEYHATRPDSWRAVGAAAAARVAPLPGGCRCAMDDPCGACDD